MSKEKLGQEAAFPMYQVEGGISKRFYAACAAMSGIVADTNVKLHYAGIVTAVTLSYCLADEMLKQENK